jgi:hypothetical protein
LDESLDGENDGKDREVLRIQDPGYPKARQDLNQPRPRKPSTGFPQTAKELSLIPDRKFHGQRATIMGVDHLEIMRLFSAPQPRILYRI